MSERPTIYLVVESDYGGYQVHRAYLDKDEAQAYVDAYNQGRGALLEIEEQALGAPDVEYDGPLYEATWMTRRKQKGERQLILKSENGFTVVVPSAVPSRGYRYQEYFTTYNPEPVEYEEPPVWIDSFHDHRSWRDGDDPGPAAVIVREGTRVVVQGTDRAAVEALCRATAVEVKQEMGL